MLFRSHYIYIHIYHHHNCHTHTLAIYIYIHSQNTHTHTITQIVCVCVCERERERENGLRSDRGNNATNEFVNLNLSLRLKKFEAYVLLGLKTFELDL